MGQSVNNYLETNPWFSRLSKSHFEKLAAIAVEVQWPKTTTIFREGQPVSDIYLVMSGRVSLEIYVPNRGRVRILTIGPDEVFGWSAVIPALGIRMATAKALEATTALAFDTKALFQFCQEDDAFGHLFYRRLCNIIAGRLTATRMQLLDMYAVDHGGDSL